MRSIITFLVTSLSITIFAQNADEPKQLTSLRESYTRARAAATAPIEKKYLEALSAMKLQLTKSGDLKGALAVDAEITQLSGVSTPQKSTPLSRSAITAEWLNSITITRDKTLYWFASPSTMYTQKKDEQKAGIAPQEFEYQITGEDSIEFSFGNADQVVSFTFDKTRKNAVYQPKSGPAVSCEVDNTPK